MPERDYKRFSSAAKSRFRDAARGLGYEQISGILYARARDGWYEMFDLQASRRGNDFFYVNYGICTPDLCPVVEAIPVKECGLLLSRRLRNRDEGAFGCGTRADIEASAELVAKEYTKQAQPWFETMCSWDSIAAEFLRTNSIEEKRLGQHTYEYGEDMRATTYGYLLFKAGRPDEALSWLREAEKIKSLPVYFTRDGRTVHVKEKYARLQKPDEDEVEALERVKASIDFIKSSAA